MKKLIFLLLACFMVFLKSYSDSHKITTEAFFEREHYRKSAAKFQYKEPLPKAMTINKEPTVTNWDWLKYVSFAIVIGAIVFLIYRIIQYTYAPDNRKIKLNEVQLNTKEDEPGIESDLEGLLEIALKKNDFREAIRIYYLLAIRKLNESRILVYTIDKTNFEYVAEVGAHPVFPLFRDLTFTFEKVWFGDAPANERKFNSYRNNFIALTEVISSNRTKTSDA